MVKKYYKSVLFLAGILATFTSFANAPDKGRIVVAPQCLLKKAKAQYTTLSSVNAFSLIKIDEVEIEKLIALKHEHGAQPCGGFMDVTQAWNTYALKQKTLAGKEKSFLLSYTKTPESFLTSSTTKYTINYPARVKEVLSYFNSQNMWNDLTFLSSFPDRSAKTDTGVQAAEWIKSQIETIAKNTGHDDVSVYYIDTDHYKQRSVVAKIGNASGSVNKSKIPGIVIGGHMDTLTNYFENKPGADDDGTGSVTVLEVARSLLASGIHFKKPIYLIWYAAEEPGLVGSSSVVAEFKAKKIPVDAVMQLDMTGYAPDNDLAMWLITDYVNGDLTSYLGELIKTYVGRNVKYTSCGYACSDHASWHQKGYPASIAFEAEMGNENPDIHTSLDTMDHLSLDHMADFAKLAIAFAVELAEPVV